MENAAEPLPPVDSPKEETPARPYRLTLVGPDMRIEASVARPQAIAINGLTLPWLSTAPDAHAAVRSLAALLTAYTAQNPAPAYRPLPGSAPSVPDPLLAARLTLPAAAYLKACGVRQLADYLTALGYWLQQTRQEPTFTTAELAAAWKEAGLRPIANPDALIRRAMGYGWIGCRTGDKVAEWFVTESGYRWLQRGFPTGRRGRLARTGLT